MSKVRDLPQIEVLENEDLLYAVDYSAGANGGRKITKEDLKASVAPTAAETKVAYESNADTNAFTDDEKTKLAGIEAGATTDQIASEVPYDNSDSGLSATNVQTAIDEVSTGAQADFRPSVVSGRILHYTGGTARFDGVFYELVGNDILLNQSVTAGEVYVDLDGIVKQTGSGVLAPPYTIVFAKFSTDLTDILSLTDERVKNSQNIVRGLLADVRDVRAGAAASEGNSGRISDAMHKHSILTGSPSTQLVLQGNSEGSSANLARADHIHNIPAAAPTDTLSPATTNAEGSGTNFARNDHTHAVATGLVGEISPILPDDAAAAGTVDKFARIDHKHAVEASAPTTTLSPATTNSEGVASSFARGDHTHAVSTALVADITTIQPDDAASAGTADNFARGDHRHAIAAAAPSTQTPDQANAEGVSTSFARADHIHNIPTEIVATIGTANAEGVASSFARSDHVHNHGSQTTPTHHAAVTITDNGFMSSTDKAKLDTLVFGFLSYTNNGSQSTTQDNTAYTAIVLDTDTGSLANSLLTKTSTTQFRTDFNGYVRVSIKVKMQNVSSNDEAVRAVVLKNGTAIAHTEIRAIGKTNTDRYGSAAGSYLLACATNDLFTVGFSNAEAAQTDTITIPASGASVNVNAVYRTS